MLRLDIDNITARAATLPPAINVTLTAEQYALALAVVGLVQAERWLWLAQTEATTDLLDSLAEAIIESI